MSQIIKRNERCLVWLLPKQHLLPSDIIARFGQVLDVIGNGITRISDKGTSVIECDLEVQLRGITPDLFLQSFILK